MIANGFNHLRSVQASQDAAMRLLELKDNGELGLTRDFIDNIPPYAILSHTWGKDEEEMTFRDMSTGVGRDKPGYRKIQFCAERAIHDHLKYIWVDTCCIDKSNNTELSEAINSMFRWYREAERCYVYLSDVSTLGSNHDDSAVVLNREAALRKSRWFTRGWTLQELIAPASVEFFSDESVQLGDKRSLERLLCEITQIPSSALQGMSLDAFTIGERINWTKNRDTKRKEDKVYSLLGIFGVYMPLIYGEGEENAFRRLREELQKRGQKHQLDESPTLLEATLDMPKRLKTLHDYPLQASSSTQPDSHADPLEHSEHNQGHLDEVEQDLTVGESQYIDDTTKDSIINLLYFTKIDERLTSLTAAQGKTCRWIFSKPEYISWNDTAQRRHHGGFLWVKGHPGTGKSTLMKLLFEDARRISRGDDTQITLSFFFLARGTSEEKSATGLYRSLLHQLFQTAEDLRDSLEWMTVNGARIIQRNGWHEEALKQTLTHAIQQLGRRSLKIFVDALDECDQKQVADMICFFEELCDSAEEAQVLLQICFSSRHYPTVVIQKGIELILEQEIGHTEDIKQYIKAKLRLGQSKQAESLRIEILEKSAGIFLWVVLVLDILNSEYPNSSLSIKRIRERLKEIPLRLSALFEMILTRDGESIERLQICLKWILFANRPLKPQELYFAIQLGLDRECSTTWDQEDVGIEEMKTFVRNSSKGLAEVTRNKASEIQFIHESVRDFLLGKYENHWPGVSGNFVGHGHEMLRDCCLAQVKASISQEVDIPDPLPPASAAEEMRKIINSRLPFLEYAVSNVLFHANSAQENAVTQEGFLTAFPLHRWIFLHNALERHNNRRYTASANLPYILAEQNLGGLIRIHPQRDLCIDVGSERYGTPVFAALATGSRDATQAFVEVLAERRPQEPLLRRLCKEYSENKDRCARYGRQFAFSRQRSVLSHVLSQNDDILLMILCASGTVSLESVDSGQRLLSRVAVSGRKAVVKFLIELGAELDSCDSSNWTALAHVVAFGSNDMAELLLDHGAKLETEDTEGRTPLLLAAMQGHETMVSTLLERGADIKTRSRDGRTPLGEAIIRGHESIVKLLLSKGAALEAVDNHGRTPLHLAAICERESTVRLLLGQGAALEAEGHDGETALSHAVLRGFESVVKLLVEEGAAIETKDSRGCTPLSLAAADGSEAMVKFLLDRGARLEAEDEDERTPLARAAKSGRDKIVSILIRRGAAVEAKDKCRRTPLSLAAEGSIALQDYQLQLMLLEQQNKKRLLMARQEQDNITTHLDGPETAKSVEMKESHFQQTSAPNMPGTIPNLSNFRKREVPRSYETIMHVLLQSGADIESKDQNGWTPLSWAIKGGHEPAVRLLLARGANPNVVNS